MGFLGGIMHGIMFFRFEENRWINVDATFGTIGNYFDKKDFYADHKYEMIREEW